MNPKSFIHDDWTKIWAGGWSLLTCSHFVDQYTKEIRFKDRPFIRETVIFVENGRSEGWARQSDRDALGTLLAQEVKQNPGRVVEICDTLMTKGDELLAFIAERQAQPIDGTIYREFWDRIMVYYQPHINVKYIVDYLEPKLLEEHLPRFEEARLHVEPVFKHTEDFMQAMSRQIGAATGYPPELVLCMTKQEITTYFENGSVPAKEVLAARNEKAALCADETTSALFVGTEITALREAVLPPTSEGSVKGTTGYGGKATGTVKVITDPSNASHFERGDVLVTGSTRPEYLPIMEKAAAFVTDAGGILSHAAITAREMKKPCVIGTKVATKVFKDGDFVEVDADTGIVRILEQ